ncbi:MAG: hypothetical protein ACREXP_18050, partial [Steroidobacteraceae bacterium]
MLLLLLGCGHASPAPAESIAACAPQQQIKIDGQSTWRCKFSFPAQHAYLVRIDRQRIDVALELLASDGRQVVKVDSPTLRSGPELLFLTLGADSQYSLVVSPVDHRAPRVELRLEIEARARTAGDASLEAGLTALTLSAKVNDKADRADSEQRVARLQAAVRQFKAAASPALEAEASLRIAHIYYWTLGDWQKCADAALTAMNVFAQAERPV